MNPEEIRARTTELSEPLDPESLDGLAALAEEADDPESLEEAAEGLDGDVSLYLRGEALIRSGDPEEALGPWLTLCDHLAHAEAWRSLMSLATRALEVQDSPAAARWLLTACEATGDRGPAKARAEELLEILPRDPRAALVAGRLREEGGGEGFGELYARALEAALHKKEEVLAEEAWMRIVESGDAAILERALLALLDTAADGRADWVATLLELGESAVHEAGLDELLVDEAAGRISKGADLEPLREHLIAALRRAHEGKAWLPKLIELTGIEQEGVDLHEAFDRIEEVFAFPPGRYVAHHSFGVGPVLDTDGEKVIIDFPETGRKEMTVSMGKRALTLLRPEDIRAQEAREPQQVAREKEEEPASLVVRALRHLGGEGKAKELREVLTPKVVAEKGWNAWWRKAREAALADPRISTAEAYRDIYRLATGDEEESLPHIAGIQDRTRALDLARRFLADQPERQEVAKEAWLPVYRSWLHEDLEPTTQARVLLQLQRWDPSRQESWAAAVGRLIAAGRGIDIVRSAGDQEQLLRLGLVSRAREEAVLAGLLSKFVGVRQAALDALEPEEREPAFRKVLAQGEADPVIQIAKWYARGGEGGFGESLSPWRLVAALLSAMAKGSGGRTEKDLLELLDPEGPLAERLEGSPPPADMVGALRMGLRSLRNHFQLNHRAERFLEATGAEAVVTARQTDEEEAEEIPVGALLAEGLLVSRGTAHRMERRVEELKKALQTTIPEEILRAREHGDLRENAEFKAAKEKQSLTATALEELKMSLQNVRFIEDLPRDEGRVLPGTEITLEDPSGERRTVWLLGDGEDYLGDHVISHRSPMGRILMGRERGETVDLPRSGEQVPHEIVEVRIRIPSREETEKDTNLEAQP